jgi:hypothetical protein
MTRIQNAVRFVVGADEFLHPTGILMLSPGLMQSQPSWAGSNGRRPAKDERAS